MEIREENNHETNLLTLRHVTYYDGEMLQRNKQILIRNGIIQDIKDDSMDSVIDENIQTPIKDCTGLYAYPAFLDGHLHFPGRVLYEMYGMDLCQNRSFTEYQKTIEGYAKRTKEHVHKGFGWNAGVLWQEGGYGAMQLLLEKTFGEEFAIVFSDDYHHAICNDAVKRLLQDKYPEIMINENNSISQRSIFQVIQNVEELTFSEEQIENAILRFQDEMLDCGMAAAQSLLFMGGDGKKEYRILQKLDNEGKIALTLRTACTVYPYEDMSQIQAKYREMKQWDSDHVHLQTLKLYLDGVVDNRSAFLLNPYENSSECGQCYWALEKLQQVCTWADKEGIQIHMHAVGDGAVHTGVMALQQAMDDNHSKGKIRHVLTHLQLAADEDIEIMGQYGMIACVQPYWIGVGDNYYQVDVDNLGSRVHQEYKIKTFADENVLLTGSSDCPVVDKPLAFEAMRNVLLRGNQDEKISLKEQLRMFTENAAIQLGLQSEYGSIAVGKRAEILLLDKEITEENICNSTVQIVHRIHINN